MTALTMKYDSQIHWLEHIEVLRDSRRSFLEFSTFCPCCVRFTPSHWTHEGKQIHEMCAERADDKVKGCEAQLQHLEIPKNMALRVVKCLVK